MPEAEAPNILARLINERFRKLCGACGRSLVWAHWVYDLGIRHCPSCKREIVAELPNGLYRFILVAILVWALVGARVVVPGLREPISIALTLFGIIWAARKFRAIEM